MLSHWKFLESILIATLGIGIATFISTKYKYNG
jgi:hypothetical protein